MFELSDDGLACFPAIDHCMDYESSNKDSLTVPCTRCESGYYLEGQRCVVGDVFDCEVYEASQNLCQ